MLHFLKQISLEKILNYMMCKLQYNQINISMPIMCLKIIILSFGGEYRSWLYDHRTGEKTFLRKQI